MQAIRVVKIMIAAMVIMITRRASRSVHDSD
jgi:hypothetical protein